MEGKKHHDLEENGRSREARGAMEGKKHHDLENGDKRTELVVLKRIHGFETRKTSHSQVCDNLFAITDQFLLFDGPGGVFLLDTNSKCALQCFDFQHVYSVCACIIPEGIIVAACGGYGLKVAFLAMYEGKLRVVSTAEEPDQRSMSNLVRATNSNRTVVLTRCYNSRKGIQQYVVTLDDTGERRLVLTLEREIPQRDCPNAALPKMINEREGRLFFSSSFF